ncbi:MAG: hypothetical protein QOE76_3522, partial [Frankiales bacterium]|nr:hypothetical protein [Frankiales bacterium]
DARGRGNDGTTRSEPGDEPELEEPACPQAAPKTRVRHKTISREAVTQARTPKLLRWFAGAKLRLTAYRYPYPIPIPGQDGRRRGVSSRAGQSLDSPSRHAIWSWVVMFGVTVTVAGVQMPLVMVAATRYRPAAKPPRLIPAVVTVGFHS